MARFETMVRTGPFPVRIVDIGGTVSFWELMGWTGRQDVQIHVVNLEGQPCAYPNMTVAVGDACNLSGIADQSFDIAFSNSVIEHVGGMVEKRRMAAEVRRVAKRYWVQTPNFWFPIEPHFLFPGWQWLPEGLRVSILQRRNVGWNARTPEYEKALEVVRHAQLLSRRDMRELFPEAKLVAERFCGLVKSWTAVCSGNGHIKPGAGQVP
jgi:hypothetical protein